MSFAQTVSITGRAYYDNNANNLFDAGDSAVVHGEVDVYKQSNYSYDSTFTDINGNYSIFVATGSYFIDLWSKTYSPLYTGNSWVGRTYSTPTTDVINFALKKRDSISRTNAIIQPLINEKVSSAGASKQYRLIYGYEGSLVSMPAKVTLGYNSLLGITSSVVPSAATAGYMEWQFSNLAVNQNDTIIVTVNYPPLPDTINQFLFHPGFIPGVTVKNISSVAVQDYTQEIEHVYLPIGQTKGIKWLRTKSITSQELGDSAGGFAYISMVDTSADGKYLYVAGNQGGDWFGGANMANYVAKYTMQGLTVWEHPFSMGHTESSGWPLSMQHTANGGCIIAYDTSNYVQSTGDAKISGISLKKFDSTGNVVWTKLIKNGGAGMYHKNIAVLANDDILIAFSIRKSDGDIISKNPDSSLNNVVLMKLSADGETIWYHLYGGNGMDIPFAIKSAQNGDILITGMSNSVTGDISGYSGPPSTNWDAFDAFVLKTDSDGNLKWSKTFSINHVDFLTSILETEGNYLLIGSSRPDSQMKDSLSNGAALWLLQLDANGNKLSERIKPISSAYRSYLTDRSLVWIMSAEKDRDGNYIIGGSSADFYGPIKTAHGDDDAIIAKINSNGNILWQKAIGGTKADGIYSLVISNKGDIIFGGGTESKDDDIYENNAIKAKENSGDNSTMLIGRIGITNNISGKIFIDKNDNHIQDAGEPLFNEGRISSYKTNDTTVARIFNGRYLSSVDTGTYTTTYSPVNDYYAPYPAQQNTVFTTFDQKDSIDFSLTPKPGIKDLQVSITAQTPARPGFGAGFRIITKNVGTAPIAGAVIKLKKPASLTYLNSSRSTSSVTADTITFVAKSMAAGFIDTLDINVTLAVPPAVNNGDTLTLTAIALPQATDTTPANNQATVREIVRGSFDPNDKTEAHAGIYTPTMKASGEPFQYLIRFQNTGTDTAFYVTVKDTLDSRVDINSLETISSSHPYKLSIDGNVATWQFNMIKLVDSTTEEAASHGYISFSIKPTDVLKIGDSISNKAAIYFDFNLPVITNTSKLLLASDQSVICPGGSTQLPAGYAGVAYQWQVNTGDGFINLTNGANYSGVNTAALLLSNIPSSYYGYQYRCVITLAGNSKINSNIYELTFASNWIGAVSTAWENAANWSCGSLPDANTDVVIKSTAIRQPEVNSTTAICRSINASSASHIWVKAGAKLDVKGK